MSDEYVDPFEEEEEDQKQQHVKTGRSAFMAGVHAADSFTGSYRGVPAVPHGGAASVKLSDIIGTPECWCGEAYGHDWPGKTVGAPHPRGDSAMSAAATDAPHINVTDLRKFDNRVARMIAELVNTYGIRYRLSDGVHVFLYGLDGESRPRKVSASRPAERTLGYIEQWVKEFVTPYLVATQAEALAARFNDPTKKVRTRKTTATVVPEPTPEPAAPQIESSQAQQAPEPEPTSEGEAPPEGYEQWILVKNGEPGNWWKKIGYDEWVCKSCGHRVYGTLLGAGSHQRMHTMTAEQRQQASHDAAMGRNAKVEGRRKRAKNAIEFLAEEYDIPLANTKADKKLEAAERRVADLEAKLAKVTQDRDEIKARLDLMREALKA